MKKLSLIIALIACTINLFAQETKVKNVDLDIENNKVVVNYDLIGNDTLNKHNVELFFIDDHYTIKLPQKLTGDYGNGISPGMNKRIEWDVFKDDITIAQKLQPKLIVDGIKKGGAKNALYSILIPGLGDYFVKDQREMIIKPYIRTTVTLGIVVAGIIANQNRSRVETFTTINKTDDHGNIIGTDTKTNGYETQNWLFNNDAEILLSTGIGLWIADIIWVYAKGTENDKLRMFSDYSFNASINNGLTTFKLSVNF